MSNIRKRSIKGTIWIYIGFLIGAINTYFFTHKDWFTIDQNGLTRSLLEISMLIFAFSTVGTTFFLNKFFPYYEDNLESKDNDILGLSLKISFIGFAVTAAGLFLIEPLVVRKFGTNSALLVEYFYMALPLAFFVMLYSLLENYSYGFAKSVTTNLLKETILRLYILLITVLKVFDIISFRVFLILFSLQYATIMILLAWILKREGKLWITFKTSRVTKKFRKKITTLLALTFIVLVVSMLRTSIDGIVLAAKQNLGKVAIFGFASYLVTVMQAPYRSIVSITIPILSRHWKNKDIKGITKIYKRSSINLLTFALFIFFLIWLNFAPAIKLFNINPDYLEGKSVFILLGIVAIIELGTGVNGQIIGTSLYWRFELWTNLLLTCLIIPLSYILTTKYGLIGPAVANLVSFTVYNSIRYWFLLKKFNMQPFSTKTIEIFVISTAAFLITYFIFGTSGGFFLIVSRCVFFSIIFILPVYLRNISPDVKPVINTLRQRVIQFKNR
jgi:O-antigen/teichoic acid export membrane protein